MEAHSLADAKSQAPSFPCAFALSQQHCNKLQESWRLASWRHVSSYSVSQTISYATEMLSSIEVHAFSGVFTHADMPFVIHEYCSIAPCQIYAFCLMMVGSPQIFCTTALLAICTQFALPCMCCFIDCALLDMQPSLVRPHGAMWSPQTWLIGSSCPLLCHPTLCTTTMVSSVAVQLW